MEIHKLNEHEMSVLFQIIDWDWTQGPLFGGISVLEDCSSGCIVSHLGEGQKGFLAARK